MDDINSVDRNGRGVRKEGTKLVAFAKLVTYKNTHYGKSVAWGGSVIDNSRQSMWLNNI